MMKDSPEGQTQYCQSCNELAAQNEILRDSLEDCLDDSREVLGNYEQVYGEKYKQHRVVAQRETVTKAVAALALPNTAANVMRQRDAQTKAEMLRMLADGQDTFDGGTGLLPFQMRKIAEELEESNG